MELPSPALRDLARRLLAASQVPGDVHVHEAVLVIDKLQNSLTRFAGADGFVSLLRRALKLARVEVPALHSIKIRPDGRLDGFEQLAADTGTDDAGREAAVAITTHLLGLLVTFVGRPLTLTLLHEVWPDASIDESQSTGETD